MPDAVAADELRQLLAAPKFKVSLRGYAATDVDALLGRLRVRANELAEGLTYVEPTRDEPITPQALRRIEFHLALRGYDVDQIDDFLERAASLLQRALDA
jgi:DivIVA domain-containing protein